MRLGARAHAPPKRFAPQRASSTSARRHREHSRLHSPPRDSILPARIWGARFVKKAYSVLMKGVGGLSGERFRKLAAIVGMLIVTAFAMAQAVHAHPELRLAESPHCAVCAVAHAAPFVVIPVIVPALLFVHAFLVLFTPSLRSTEFLLSLASRPPPLCA